MTAYMHCRPCYGTNISIYSSSFLFTDPNGNLISSQHNCIPTSYHHYHYDQSVPLPPTTTSLPRRRRRLQDPITTYASNYYATLPRQMSKEPAQQISIPSLSPSRRNIQQSNSKDLYCDLYNLLEQPSSSPSPSPPITSKFRQRRKLNSTQDNVENVHPKSKTTNNRRRFTQQSHYSNERKRHDDNKLSSTEQYGQLTEKTKKTNDIIYQRRRPSNKGFFRRIVCNYFCVPSTIANNGYSS